jgi:hypothetical protein
MKQQQLNVYLYMLDFYRIRLKISGLTKKLGLNFTAERLEMHRLNQICTVLSKNLCILLFLNTACHFFLEDQ